MRLDDDDVDAGEVINLTPMIDVVMCLIIFYLMVGHLASGRSGHVNLPSAGVEYQLPFGGTKDSSFGPKEQGPAAFDFYSDYKTVYLKY